MMITLSSPWRVGLAATLGALILVSACWRAPRRTTPPSELRRLVLCGLGLYGVGGLASLTHHPALAGLVYATGIATCALAAWLSRGPDSEGRSDAEVPDDRPPPDPPGGPQFDWNAFEREFGDYARRLREPAGQR
jgi:hypothetical protein